MGLLFHRSGILFQIQPFTPISGQPKVSMPPFSSPCFESSPCRGKSRNRGRYEIHHTGVWRARAFWCHQQRIKQKAKREGYGGTGYGVWGMDLYYSQIHTPYPLFLYPLTFHPLPHLITLD